MNINYLYLYVIDIKIMLKIVIHKIPGNQYGQQSTFTRLQVTLLQTSGIISSKTLSYTSNQENAQEFITSFFMYCVIGVMIECLIEV